MSMLNTKIKPFYNHALKNGKFVTVSEKDILGKWNVFFFYPADFTFVCPTELKDLSNHYYDFQKLQVNIYSISTDTHFTHKAWCDASKSISKIQYTMIADPSGNLTRNFEVMNEENGLPERGTFIIDTYGIIQSIEINIAGIGRNSKELLRKIEALQHISVYPNEVCPANWKKGEKTLLPSIELVGKI
ncbi:alkyl hydroperoxide reductase subunit C [Candidatus Tachikawaea gelatinosa]|uniref:Alkyl hydroperoxide reductase C n=1 Tax=Candidatus Tachikawaea gelatinosa TaxID=1410383 RepID=A0A090AIX3_9ENTR|nr:alkyl hydroperoxide reductase subunit C [Candidatus Tachikawaea gelatinosa]BAP58378.1 alkyl hydroperoxide reductase C22 subunit [Candidatus Tachikawaea gelatinosa]